MLLTMCTLASAQWPAFRGPEANMTVVAADLPAVWDDSTHVKWTYNMEGSGWSSPVIWDGKVFLSTAVTIKKMS